MLIYYIYLTFCNSFRTNLASIPFEKFSPKHSPKVRPEQTYQLYTELWGISFNFMFGAGIGLDKGIHSLYIEDIEEHFYKFIPAEGSNPYHVGQG